MVSIEYKGIRIGTVSRVGVEKNKEESDINTFAIVNVEPERLPTDDLNEDMEKKERKIVVDTYFEHMIKQGMRAQLKSNILTGQSLILLDMFKEEKQVAIQYIDNKLVVPTVPETVTGLIKQINELLARLKSLPVENIGKNLDESTENLNKLLKSLNVEEGGMTGVQLNETMNELSKAARSIRIMSEYLERHPEALIKGKRAE